MQRSPMYLFLIPRGPVLVLAGWAGAGKGLDPRAALRIVGDSRSTTLSPTQWHWGDSAISQVFG